jgi:hypothetical protein
VTRPQASQPRRGARRALLALPAVVAGMFTLVPAGAGPVPTSATVIVREMCQKVQCTLLPGQSSGGGTSYPMPTW